jgi:hypothetical protein
MLDEAKQINRSSICCHKACNIFFIVNILVVSFSKLCDFYKIVQRVIFVVVDRLLTAYFFAFRDPVVSWIKSGVQILN